MLARARFAARIVLNFTSDQDEASPRFLWARSHVARLVSPRSEQAFLAEPVWSPDGVAASVSPHAGPVQAYSQPVPQLLAGVRERVWFQWPVFELGEIRQLAVRLQALPRAAEPACCRSPGAR